MLSPSPAAPARAPCTEGHNRVPLGRLVHENYDDVNNHNEEREPDSAACRCGARYGGGTASCGHQMCRECWHAARDVARSPQVRRAPQGVVSSIAGLHNAVPHCACVFLPWWPSCACDGARRVTASPQSFTPASILLHAPTHPPAHPRMHTHPHIPTHTSRLEAARTTARTSWRHNHPIRPMSLSHTSSPPPAPLVFRTYSDAPTLWHAPCAGRTQRRGWPGPTSSRTPAAGAAPASAAAPRSLRLNRTPTRRR